MKKSICAFALVAGVLVASLGVFAGTAGAHTATLTYDCFNVTAQFENFASDGASVNTAVVTVNGTPHDFSFTTSSFTANVPFVSHSGDPDVVASVSWIGFDDHTGSADATFPADSCAPPPTTTVPPAVSPGDSGVTVSPADVVKTATAPAAVVAAPAFTG